MLTCVNPSISFKLKDKAVQHKGVAVALKWLLPLVRQFGGSHPPEGSITQELRTLSIGDGRGEIKQHFNKFPNGVHITRAAGGVQVTLRSCVVIKNSAFGAEHWKAFCKGMHATVLMNFSLLETLFRKRSIL